MKLQLQRFRRQKPQKKQSSRQAGFLTRCLKERIQECTMIFRITLWLFVVAAIALCDAGRRNHFTKTRDKGWTQNSTANTTTGQCSKRTVIMTRLHGVLRSPGYPRGYAKNQRCTWHIIVPRGFRIRLRFRRQFQIQTSAGCAKDHVMLAQSKHFRNPLIFCGNTRPNGLLIPRNNLWIRFRSDNRNSAKGFFASYVAIDENECDRPVCTFPSLCRNTVGSYACDCPDGYENKGRRASTKCIDVDECKVGTAWCEHKCVNTDGSYYCLCKKGYRLAPDGKRCRDFNECQSGNAGCSHFCRNTRSSFRCSCPRGYMLHTDKKTCFPEVTFNSAQYLASVRENSQLGSLVTSVTASSFIKSKKLYYELLSENLQTPTKFTIEHQSGKILVNGPLDREKSADYLLEVSAGFQSANGSGALGTLAKTFVIVNILDENDHSPIFVQPSFYMKIPCNVTIGKIVYRGVQAKDGDSGDNAKIKYRFQSKNLYFSILPNTGRIRLVKSLKRFCNSVPAKTFNFSIMARDLGAVPNVAHASIQLDVTGPGSMSRGASLVHAKFLEPAKADNTFTRRVRNTQAYRKRKGK